MDAYDFSRVSPTALFPLFARGEYTDIPFARETLAHLRTLQSFPPDTYPPETMHSYAPFFEARFKSVTHILIEQGVTQVLELAAGFSPRGMDLSRRGVVYVETDLPEMIQQKRSLVTALLGAIPPNLHLCAASVLDENALLAACAHFAQKPVAIATEGLLRYLTFDEKTVLARNVHAILTRFGGAWITPDIHLRAWAQDRTAGFTRRIEQGLGRDLWPNYFESDAHARSFFESCGFTVEERPLLEGVRASVASLASAPASASALQELDQRQTYILRPATD